MKFMLSNKERITGMFLFFTFIVFVTFIVIISVKKKMFYDSIKYYTLLKNGEDLRSGSDILLSGMKVGELGDLKMMRDNSILAEIIIYKEYANRIKGNNAVLIYRLYGIGEKRIKVVVNDDFISDNLEKQKSSTNNSSENASHIKTLNNKSNICNNFEDIIDDEIKSFFLDKKYIVSIEKKDILDKIDEIDFESFMITLEKTTSVAERLLGQLDEGDRIVKLGEILDESAILLKNLNVVITKSKGPLLELLSNNTIEKTFISLDKLLSNKDLELLLKELGKISKDGKLYSTVSNLDELLSAGKLTSAVSGMDSLFHEPGLYSLLESFRGETGGENKTAKLLTELTIVLENLNKVSPELPYIAKELMITMKELSIVLKALQKTWLLDDESEEVIEELKKVIEDKKE